ncbi:hypothetical protein KKI22_01900 [Patescibacteria group bacterium]|nr:hypothetical protein [Patescibacteria group bacterium]
MKRLNTIQTKWIEIANKFFLEKDSKHGEFLFISFLEENLDEFIALSFESQRADQETYSFDIEDNNGSQKIIKNKLFFIVSELLDLERVGEKHIGLIKNLRESILESFSL